MFIKVSQPSRQLSKLLPSAVVASGVDSFNARTGVVVSQSSDYFSFYTPKIGNAVIINSESDFPTQDATTITLEDDVAYIIGNPIVTAKRFIVGSATLQAFATTASPLLTYTGTGAMFTVSSTRFSIRFITLSCPNAELIQHTGDDTFNFDHRSDLLEVIVTDCVGIFNSITGASLTMEFCQASNVSGPYAINIGAGNVAEVAVNNSVILGLVNNAVGVNLHTTSAVVKVFEAINLGVYGDPGAHYISSGVNSVNLPTGTIGNILDGHAADFTVPLVGADPGDIRWVFKDTEGIEDSLICANPSLTTPITVPITTQNEFVKVAQSAWNASQISKVSVTADGDIINTGERPIKIAVNGFCTMSVGAGGGSDIMAVRLVVNDDPNLPASVETENTVESSDISSASIVGLINLPPGDSVSVYVANFTRVKDIAVSNAKLALLTPA